MCKDMNVPFLGKMPIDPRLARACDEGKNYCALYPDAPGVKALREIISSANFVFWFAKFLLMQCAELMGAVGDNNASSS